MKSRPYTANNNHLEQLMIDSQLFDIEKILTLGNPEFIIEDAKIQDLNGGIRKKFTSLSKSPVTYTTIYDPTVFRWKFGDEEDPDAYTETTDRVTYHTYKKPGTYLVQHQACNFCTCSGWGLCFQSIDVVPPPVFPAWLLFGGFFALLLIRRKECQDYDTKKGCEKADCEWLEAQKRCTKKIKVPPREKSRKEEVKRLIKPEEKLKPFPKSKED